MTPEDKPRFSAIIQALCVTFNRESSAALTRGYWLALEDLTIEEVEEAAARALKVSRFLSTPVELRELAGRSSNADAALTAWDTFSHTVATVGAYKHVDFSDGVINATVRSLGGWPKVCAISVEEFDKWLRKDFLTVYESWLRRGVSPEAGRPLAGLAEAGVSRSVRGIDTIVECPRPVLIACETTTERLAAPSLPKGIPAIEFKKP